jgi:integrase
MANLRNSTAVPKKDAKSGTWSFSFGSAHPNPDGSRRQIHRRGFPTQKAARAELDRLRDEDAELYAPTAGGLTVSEVVQSFLRAKGLAGRSANTVAQYKWAGAIIADRWGGWAASKLTGDHLEVAYAEMLAGGRRQWRRGKGTEATGKPMSRRSVEVVHKSAKAAFQLAVDRGQLVRNPAALISVATERQRAERPYWTPEQVGAFLTFTAGHKDVPAGLIDVLADTGARAGEVAGIRWSNVDLEAGTVTISSQLVSDPDDSKVLSVGPTKRPRAKSTIGLHPATVVALKHRKREQGHRPTGDGCWLASGRSSGGSRLHMEGRHSTPPEDVESDRRSLGCRSWTTSHHSAWSSPCLCDCSFEGTRSGRSGGSATWQYAEDGAGGLRARHPGRRCRRRSTRRRSLPKRRKFLSEISCDHPVTTEAVEYRYRCRKSRSQRRAGEI